MLSHSPVEDSEEYTIHDFEGFARYTLSEYEGIEAAHNIACFIEKLFVVAVQRCAFDKRRN